jgi:hypothetical protein
MGKRRFPVTFQAPPEEALGSGFQVDKLQHIDLKIGVDLHSCQFNITAVMGQMAQGFRLENPPIVSYTPAI